MKKPKHLIMGGAYFATYFGICIILLVSACTFPISSSQESDAFQSALESTLAAMRIQSTTIVLQATQDAQNIQAQATQLAGQQLLLLTQQAALTAQPTPSSGGEVSPPATGIPASPETTQPSILNDTNFQTKLEASKILLFEDISGSKTRLRRYVKEALDKAKYSYTDVGSGQGWLKDQLESETNWDLIIVSSEVSGRISGDFFDELTTYASKGTALILEFGDLDEIFEGKSKNLLNECGIEFEMDLPGSASGPLWFLQPDNSIFNEPYELIPKLDYSKRQWDDSGDLVKIKKYGGKVVGDAVLLIGTRKDMQDSHGVLTSCMGGRVLIQTFTSHQYDSEAMVKLWENYVYYTLKNHYLSQN